MTTKEVNKKLAELNKEINKVKAYATKLAKKLIENDIDVPLTNWAEGDPIMGNTIIEQH